MEIGRAGSIRDRSVSCQCALTIAIRRLAIRRSRIVWRARDLYAAAILFHISTPQIGTRYVIHAIAVLFCADVKDKETEDV